MKKSETLPVGAQSLRQTAYERIKQNILDAAYKPGSQLSEHQLAEEFGISRTPIREALRELASRGLVRILPQRGVIVAEFSLQDIIEVYQLRVQLECFAVRLAARHMEPEHRKGLATDHNAAKTHLDRGNLRAAYNHAVLMHSRIIDLARNERLARIMGQLADAAHRYGLLTLRAGHARQAIHEHGLIIDALLAGDEDLAAQLMLQHLDTDRDIAIKAALPAGVSPGAFQSEAAIPIMVVRAET
jgi:DNA-binding GntR family transcriptional regulator